MSRYKDTLLIYMKGVGMGGADVVPGLSGGTIALITGIYERLLNSIKSVDAEAVKMLVQFRIKDLWLKIEGAFLLPLLLGIATSLLTFSRLIKFLMENHPVPLWSFFFGLILVSAIWVLREISEWKLATGLFLLAGLVIAYFITESTPSETPETWWFIIISGAVAICAMILPGISGAFILLIFGKYEFIINAVNKRDLLTLGLFASGCIIGILSFSRVVSWMLKNFHDLTIALLAGFMIGSLNKVWPWKIPLAFRMDSHGNQVAYITKNTSPSNYLEQTGNQPHLLWAILLFSMSILLVYLLEQWAKHYQPKAE